MNDWIKKKTFTVRELWNYKEFTRPDGSTGSVQKVLNVDDKSLVVWDNDVLALKEGDTYEVTGIRLKDNREGYAEYNTGKFSTIGVVEKEKPHTVPFDSTEPTQLISILKSLEFIIMKLGRQEANLAILEEKLDDLASMIDGMI